MKITLGAIEDLGPCWPSWRKGLIELCVWDDSVPEPPEPEPDHRPALSPEERNRVVTLEWILDTLGLAEAVWSLRVMPDLGCGYYTPLACDIADMAIPYTSDHRVSAAIETARAYARGQASKCNVHFAMAAAKGAVDDANGAGKRAEGEAAYAAWELCALALGPEEWLPTIPRYDAAAWRSDGMLWIVDATVDAIAWGWEDGKADMTTLAARRREVSGQICDIFRGWVTRNADFRGGPHETNS